MKNLVKIILILFLFSCNQTRNKENKKIADEGFDKKLKNDKVIIKRRLWDFDKVLIKKWDSNELESNTSSTVFTLDSISTKILKDSINSNPTYGYIAAIEPQNKLLLYKNGHFVESIRYVNMWGKTIVYDGHKKISKFTKGIIDTLTTKKKLNKLLFEFKSTSAGRDALEYCQTNQIPYEDGIKLFSKWMDFDGEFIFSYSDLNRRRNDDSIKKMVQNIIPTEKFEITPPQSLIYYDSAKLTYRVYCDNKSYEDFINKENTKIKISTYSKFHPKLIIYSSDENIKKIDKIKN